MFVSLATLFCIGFLELYQIEFCTAWHVLKDCLHPTARVLPGWRVDVEGAEVNHPAPSIAEGWDPEVEGECHVDLSGVGWLNGRHPFQGEQGRTSSSCLPSEKKTV